MRRESREVVFVLTQCHLSSERLLILSCLGSKASRKKIVQQTAGLLMLGLYVLWSTATTRYNELSPEPDEQLAQSESSLQGPGPPARLLSTVNVTNGLMWHTRCADVKNG